MAARRPSTTDPDFGYNDALFNAIKAHVIEKQPKKRTAKQFHIGIRSFSRYIEKFEAQVPDISVVGEDDLLKVVRSIASQSTLKLDFDEKQEDALMNYIIKCCQLYYGLSITELKRLAFQFAKKMNLKYPDSWDEDQMAGWEWYHGFMGRHKNLILRSPEHTSLKRIKAFCRENVDHFFRNFDAVKATYPFSPSSIWNMGEIGFSAAPAKMGEIISIKGLKSDEHITSTQPGSIITLAFAANASGNTIPPFYIFPRKKMRAMYITHAIPETVGYANGSGWMAQPEFVKWIQHFIKYSHSSKERPTLLFLDSHVSYLSVEAIDVALANGITLLTFPPYCSHRLQPLEVSVFGPVKGRYNALHNAWMKDNVARIIDLTLIPKFVQQALLRGATGENITAGFRATGISPYDPDIFDENDFISLGVYEASAVATDIECAYGLNEQRRIVIDANSIVAAPEITSMSTSEPSTSGLSRASTLTSTVSAVGPLRGILKQFDRGPQLAKGEAEAVKRAAAEKSNPAKRIKTKSSSS